MAQSSSEAFEALKTYLVENYNAKIASGGKEVIKRCHFCGDSRDPSSRHLYIGLNNGAIVYNCFKCQAHGRVDGKFLREMGCYDTNIIILCQEQNSKAAPPTSSYSGGYRNGRIIQTPNLNVFSNSNLTYSKLDYLQYRLGYKFNLRDATRFKVIPNLKEFLDGNSIGYTRHPEMIKQINDNFIGFLTADNCFISLRRIVPEGVVNKAIDTRYIKYNIFGLDMTPCGYYIIPNTVDTTRPLDVHIAEGALDIMSIYFNVAPLGTNGIFASIGGKSYLSLIRFLIVHYGVVIDNLHIYMDSDVNLSMRERIKEDLIPYNAKIYLHINRMQGEKDYGVPMDRIIDSANRI